MNLISYGKDAHVPWARWGEKVVGPEYPLHVVLEGKAEEFQVEPFAPFVSPGATLVIIPAAPSIVEHLIVMALLHPGARKEALREAGYHREVS
jgi:hypothetical protein